MERMDSKRTPNGRKQPHNRGSESVKDAAKHYILFRIAVEKENQLQQGKILVKQE